MINVKSKKVWNVLFLSLIVLLFLGCTKDHEPADSMATLFGTVYDENGMPLTAVEVNLYDQTSTTISVGQTVTGTDGFYQLNEINPIDTTGYYTGHKRYTAEFSRIGYYTQRIGIQFESSRKVELSVVMRKDPRAISSK